MPIDCGSGDIVCEAARGALLPQAADTPAATSMFSFIKADKYVTPIVDDAVRAMAVAMCEAVGPVARGEEKITSESDLDVWVTKWLNAASRSLTGVQSGMAQMQANYAQLADMSDDKVEYYYVDMMRYVSRVSFVIQWMISLSRTAPATAWTLTDADALNFANMLTTGTSPVAEMDEDTKMNITREKSATSRAIRSDQTALKNMHHGHGGLTNKLRTVSINQAAVAKRRVAAVLIAWVAGVMLTLLVLSILTLALTGRVNEMLFVVSVVSIVSIVYFIYKYFRESVPLMAVR
jgi:hypothetical protein